VKIAGGANVVQQYLSRGLLDELQLHIAPVLLGGGVRLLDHLGSDTPTLERMSVVDSPAAAHLRYRVVK
jgi:dihydrofolate reductase